MRGISQSPWRLFCALLLSLSLHAGAYWFALVLIRVPSPPPMMPLQARIESPSALVPPPEILKNTIREAEPAPPPRKKAAGRGEGEAAQVSGRRLEQLMERLSETLAYPAEAVEQGLEGEVILMLSQDAQGRMTQAAVASSSGHVLLDEAALRAVRELRTLGPEFNGKTWLFPVTFALK